jgi:hypothetical protein
MAPHVIIDLPTMNTVSIWNRCAVSGCPSCQQNVTLPVEFITTTVGECPHCGATMTLEEFWAAVAPMVRLVPSENGGMSAVEKLRSPRNKTADRLGITEVRTVDSIGADVPPFERSTAPVQPPSGFYGHRNKVSNRNKVSSRRHRESSLIASRKTSWGRIVAGAVVAIPLAQLVLWWIFKADPISLGPAVARIVPFVVPYDLRGIEAAVEAEPEPTRHRALDLPSGIQIPDPLSRPSAPRTKDRPQGTDSIFDNLDD